MARSLSHPVVCVRRFHPRVKLVEVTAGTRAFQPRRTQRHSPWGGSRGICHAARAIQPPHEMEGLQPRPGRRSRDADRSLANRPPQHEPIAKSDDIPAADLPVERENATPPGEVLRQAEGGNSAEAPYGAPVNVGLERMGGIFDQRNIKSAARCDELDDTVGKTVGVTCQNGGNGRPRCVIDCVDAHVSIVGRHRRHHRPEPGRESAEEHCVVLEWGHEYAIAGREEQLEGEVNGKSTGRHEHAFASDTGFHHRLDVTFDVLAHEPSSPRDTARSWQIASPRVLMYTKNTTLGSPRSRAASSGPCHSGFDPGRMCLTSPRLAWRPL